MPFERPSLSDLRGQVAQDIGSALPGTDPLLRFSNLNIMAMVQAGLAHLHYGYLDWIAQQATPFTATSEFLEAWGSMKNVHRNPATQAAGTVQFTGTNGAVIFAGTQLVRGDGKTFTTTATATVAGGSASVAAKSDADPAGLLGAFGNTGAGSTMSLGQAVAGVQSTGTVTAAFTGGADLESDASLRTRVLLAYQNPPHGGDADDYKNWALEVSGVTRAWCVPNGFGAGTVLVYVMLDDAQAVNGGLPQGTNGVAAGEPRDTVATGDQLTVANHIFPLQPVTALVYVLAPATQNVAFTISGIASASADTKAAISQAITDVFRQYSTISDGSTTVQLSYIESAIAAIPNTAGFVITNPTSNIVAPPGTLSQRGIVTYV
jgi:uncharacterized phage protein gp47/JayE